ncbi:universal stress protein [Kitasatospora sp. CMC57]|uniref:Universal stress protein n=1 Tax=Kitasatospora sp. CMC57 TaxID=3231513 RepID=A0AB33K6L9_9ACTN
MADMAVRCVVAAVDGSAGSLRAVDWAADEASRRQVPLRLVHASLWERYEPETEDGDGPLSARTEVRHVADAARARATERQPSVETVTEVIPEEAVSALLGLGHLAPVLVLGHRGTGGFAGLLLGSVALRVAARAAYPVVVVRSEPSAPVGRVVLALSEDQDEAAAAAAFAVAEARLRGAELDLVHAWQRDSFLSGSSVLLADTPAQELAERLVAGAALPGAEGLTVHRHARRGRAAKVLLDAAADADVLVLGAARRHGLGGLQLGSVSHAVLHHAPCPVAVVPAG